MDGQLSFATLDYAGKKKLHTAGVTSGNVQDAKVMDRLVRHDDTAVYGDKGYASDAKRAPRRRRACSGR